jgi:Asp-tRNA(Asn)/Glu-tRNA(Gln) amidotransferase A subunit family amidase
MRSGLPRLLPTPLSVAFRGEVMTGVDNCSAAARDNCSTTRRTVPGSTAAVAATFALSTYTNELLARTPPRGLPSTNKQAGNDLRSGSLGVTELFRAFLDGAKQVGPKLNPFSTLNEDEAPRTAAILESKLTQRMPPRPLHGIPIVYKDNIDTVDTLTTVGSEYFAERVPATDAYVVTLLKRAGAVDVFLTPTHPFVAPPFSVDAETDPGARQLTVPVSFTGFPAISVPCGFSSSGIPIGFQIVANEFQEQLLFRIAAALQGVTEFHSRRPQTYWDGRA